VSDEPRYANPYLTGVALGGVLLSAFLLTGHGLGASGALARFLAWAERLVAPGHVDRTPALAELAGGSRAPLDSWLIWTVLGALAGGFCSGLVGGRVRVETLKGPGISPRTRWVAALVGGVLVGYGARLARGCTSGQALSGGAVLSAGSWAFMFAVFGGGYLLAWPVRRLWLPAPQGEPSTGGSA
jgi:hypothetical protein